MERRILKCSETHGYFVAEQAESVFGFAYASQYRIRSSYQSSAAVSVYLVPEAHGFTHIGTLKDVGRKFGNWHDTAIYQLIISDTTSDVHR